MCRGYPICTWHKERGVEAHHVHYRCPEKLKELDAAKEESLKNPVRGTNGVFRPRTCNYCKLYGHTGTYCPEKFKNYPDMKPYVEKFPGEELVYEAINDVMDRNDKLLDLISKQQKLIDQISERVSFLENKKV